MKLPQWVVPLLVVLSVIAAASSLYTAYKVYQMSDGRLVPTKGKR